MSVLGLVVMANASTPVKLVAQAPMAVVRVFALLAKHVVVMPVSVSQLIPIAALVVMRAPAIHLNVITRVDQFIVVVVLMQTVLILANLNVMGQGIVDRSAAFLRAAAQMVLLLIAVMMLVVVAMDLVVQTVLFILQEAYLLGLIAVRTVVAVHASAEVTKHV